MADYKALMVFQKTDGKNARITVSNADSTIDADRMNTAMDTILSENIFAPGEMDLVAKVEGKLITTETADFEMN